MFMLCPAHPAGGGGLAAGVAAFVKALRPAVKVIGVEPAGANAMAQSLARGERVTLQSVDWFVGERWERRFRLTTT
jgi:threonine dehydratase